MNAYPFIEAEQAGKHNVKRACELLKVSRSAYYQHAHGEQSERERVDAQLTEKIRAVHGGVEGHLRGATHPRRTRRRRASARP